MGRSTPEEQQLSDTRKYRKFTAQQKTEMLRKWREQFLAAGAERLSGKSERTELDDLRAQVSKLERALGRKTMEVEVAGELMRGWQ
jgi:transposase